MQTFAKLPAPDKEWLQHRMDIFEAVCFPSVANQTNQDFSWIIFVDIETPLSILQRLATLQGRRPFEIRFLSHFDEIEVQREIHRVNGRTPYILTTRLDNDDAIATKYLQAVRESIRLGGRKWLNFDRGLQLDDHGLYKTYRSSNAFISLIEENINPITAMCIKHSHASRMAEVSHMKGEGWWLQVVHGRNLMNYIHRPSKCLPWKKAEFLSRGFCEEVVTYIGLRYAVKKECSIR
ncbi:MAG: glycosyltransferase [Edaphobacter sp.]